MTRKLQFALWLMALQWALACPSPAAAGAVEDTNACASNLRNLYIAIQAYRQAHKELPNRLSDLVPDAHLTDLRALRCPVADALGTDSYKDWNEAEIFDRRTTYLYEFGTNPIPKVIRGGAGRTMRQWKRAQMSLVGGRVPIVRCLVHGTPLNLGFDGTIYPSPNEWEDLFRDVIRKDDLSPTRLLAGGAPVRVVSVPTRDPKTPGRLINLEEFFNASLSRTWWSSELSDMNSHLGSLPTGMQTFQGTAFDVRGLIQLRCDKFISSQFPVAVTDIPIGLRCERLYFLHAAAWDLAAPANMIGIIGSYVVHFDGGRTERLPIVYGSHLIEWRRDPVREFKNPENSAVAWTGQYKSSSGQTRLIRLYRTTWKNPSPETLIRSLDFETTILNGAPSASTAPFLVAVSAEP